MENSYYMTPKLAKSSKYMQRILWMQFCFPKTLNEWWKDYIKDGILFTGLVRKHFIHKALATMSYLFNFLVKVVSIASCRLKLANLTPWHRWMQYSWNKNKRQYFRDISIAIWWKVNSLENMMVMLDLWTQNITTLRSIICCDKLNSPYNKTNGVYLSSIIE